MMLYVFNHYYPDNGGFTKRCIKELEMLSTKYDVVVLCRGKKNEIVKEVQIKGKKIKFFYFYPLFSINNKIVNYDPKSAGLYEIMRNLGLMLGMSKALIAILAKFRTSRSMQLYSVVSPLTVPLIAYAIGKFFGAIPKVVEFHDLEPEMAIHVKKLTDKSIILKIEYLLEKLCCKLYKSVIVTSNSQAERITARTGVSKHKVLVIPNSIQVEPLRISDHKSKSKEFIVGYVSSLSYDYTVNGLLKMIDILAEKKSDLANMKFIIIGDGELLPKIKNRVKRQGLLDHFIFTGKVANVSEYVNKFDVAIIPWEKNIMSEIILPTKLFEYFSVGKPVIAPFFGEFKKIINLHYKNGFLYQSLEELVSILFNLSKDNQLYKITGKNAYNTYSRFFNITKFQTNYLTFIHNL